MTTRIVSLALPVVALSYGATAGFGEEPAKPKAIQTTSTRDGLLSIGVRQVGNRVKIVVKNDGTGELALKNHRPFHSNGVTFSVVDRNGRPVRRTVYGEFVFGDSVPAIMVHPDSVVQSGVSFTLPIDPARYYDITMPGRYRFTAKVEGTLLVEGRRSKVSIESPTLEFWVKSYKDENAKFERPE